MADAIPDLENYGIFSQEDYHGAAFSRNIGLLTKSEQEQLSRARIAIPGMGGVGGVHLVTMARTGICRFNIADFDVFEPVNVNRQYGALTNSFGRPKIEVMKDLALQVNPYADITLFPRGIDADSMDDFLADVDIVLDGLDFFCFDIRRLLFTRAREKGIPVITAGPMGFSCALLVFAPDQGMSFDQYFNIVEGMAPEDKSLAFALGLAPSPTHIRYMDFSRVDLKAQSGPSLNVSCQVCAGMAGTEVLRILLNRPGLRPVPCYAQFDPYLMKLKKGRLFMGNKNPVQKAKIWYVKNVLTKKQPSGQRQPPSLPPAEDMKNNSISSDILTYLVNAGIQAPSGDNAQPWKFSISENTIQVILDPSADSSFFNVNQAASLISCGAAVENITIAATRFSLLSDVRFSEENSKAICHITLTPGDVPPDPLNHFIWQRHTNRTMYKKEALPAHVLQQMKETAAAFSGVRLHCLTDRKQIKAIAKIIFQADRIRTEHRPLHDHLNAMIRFTPESVEKTRDGLPLKNLEAGFAGEQFLKISRPWPVMNIFNKIGLGRMVALHSYQGIINSSAVCLITIDKTDKNDFIVGGRALERVWLALTRAGYHVQPMTAVTLFFMRIMFNSAHAFLPRHVKMLEKIRPEYQRLFPGLDENTGQIMLFRIGHGRDITCHTRRKQMEAFLT